MTERYQEIRLDLIVPSPFNPRKTFDPQALEELAQTIREHGVQQPAVVREREGGYELVMGERRYRASLLAGKEVLPCIVREYTDAQVLEVIVIENNQRADVNAAEESVGFSAILEQPAYAELGKKAAVDVLAKKLGRSVSYVWQRLKLADLSLEARGELLNGQISPSHAILLARLSHEAQEKLLTELLWDTKWDTKTNVYVRKSRAEGGAKLSVQQLVDRASRSAGILLSTAPFDLLDPFPGVGRGHSCEGCPARTSTDPAIGDSLPDACRDAACFRAKCEAFRDRRIAELSEEFGDRLLILSDLYSHTKPVQQGAISHSHWGESRQASAHGTAPGVVVESDDPSRLGKFVWANRYGRAPETEAEKEARLVLEAEKEKRLASETNYRKALFAAIVEAVPDPGDPTLARLASQSTRDRIYDAGDADRAAAAARLGKCPKREAKASSYTSLSAHQAARYFVGLLCSEEVEVQTYSMDREPATMLRIAGLYGVDAVAIRNEAYGQAKLFDSAMPEESAPEPESVQTSLPIDAPTTPRYGLVWSTRPAPEATETRKPTGIVAWVKSLALAADVGTVVGIDPSSFEDFYFDLRLVEPALAQKHEETFDKGYIEYCGRQIHPEENAFVFHPEELEGLAA